MADNLEIPNNSIAEPDIPEPENMDQTDFIDTSVLSMKEDDVFPVVETTIPEETPEVLSEQKKKSTQKKLLIGVAVFFLILILILLLALTVQQQNATQGQTGDLETDQTKEQMLREIDDQLYVVEFLNDSFVLPPISEEITP